MSAFNWINRLRKDERGNVLVVGAATMPLLMGSAALAIDTVQLTLWKRQLQRTADSAAIAGAYALAQGVEMNSAVNNDLDENIDTDLAHNEKPMLTTTLVEAGSFSGGTINKTQDCTARGVPTGTHCWDQAVKVNLTAEGTLPFMRMFTNSMNTLTAEGTAALVGTGKFCMVSLYDGTSEGIVAGGSSHLGLGCGIVTNSRAANAIRAHGGATISAVPAAAVGGISGGSHFVSPTKLQPYSVPAKDPFKNRPDPVKPSNCSSQRLEVPNGATVTLDLATDPHGGCYAGWKIDGTLNLVGTETNKSFFVDNALLDVSGTINATKASGGATIVLLGNDSDLKQNGGGVLALSAPQSGDMKGIAMWRDRYATPVTIKINGGADTAVTGAFYLPSADVWLGGNADIAANCFQLVGRVLTFKGGGNIDNVCTGNNYGAFEVTAVRLVS